jgi:hypothetical protein
MTIRVYDTIFAKLHKEKQENPKSKEFQSKAFALLESHGIKDKRSLNECFLMMQKSAIFYFVGLQKDLDGPDINEIEQLEENMREIVAKYGVTDKGDQELLITDYFILINELGGEQG